MSQPRHQLYPANMVHLANVRLMLGQRRRRWPNFNPALVECTMFAGHRSLQAKRIGPVLV